MKKEGADKEALNSSVFLFLHYQYNQKLEKIIEGGKVWGHTHTYTPTTKCGDKSALNLSRSKYQVFSNKT